MSIGPLRRLTGAAGLLALVPLGVWVFTGTMTLRDAAMRAIAILVVVVVVGRVAGWWLSMLADGFDAEDDQRSSARSDTQR